VLRVQPMITLRTGGSGVRYTVLIGARERYLYEDRDLWYIEDRQ